MKILLAMLAGVSIAVAPTVSIINNIKTKSDINFDVLNHQNEMIKAIEKENLVFFDGYYLYSQVDEMIYKILDEDYLNEYMNTVYMLYNKLSNIAEGDYEENKLEEQRNSIEKALQGWSNSEDLNDLIELYDKQASEEKEVLSKIFYAYNQTSSKLMIEDLEIYQEHKIKNVKASAAIASLKNQIDLYKTKLSVWENTQKWQKELVAIYDNMIDRATELQNQFIYLFDTTLASPEAFFKNMFDKKEIIFDQIIKKYLPKNPSYKELVQSRIENREQKPDELINDWILIGQNSEPSDPEVNPIEIDPNELYVLSDEEVEKRLEDKINPEDPEEIKLEKTIGVVSDVLMDVYRIDDILFSSLHKGASNFFEFVNNQIPRLSLEVKESFEKNGVQVETKFDEDIQTAIEMADALSSQILDILSPSSEVFGQIRNLAFATIDKVQDWYKTISVAKDSQKAIDLIINIRDNYSEIPEELMVDEESVNSEIEEAQDELLIQEQIFKETESILENSKYDYYNENLNSWNNFFSDYSDYLKIINLGQTKRTINLNPLKYFNSQVEVYFKMVVQRRFTYENIINKLEGQDYKNLAIENIKNENIKLENLNSFIEKHKEDFK
ncbi:hypothetical protein [Spiroplasma sp. BIUS-1]|uniref:hypothetical protein n=1 Tax=Spiroplasma sp. BIUS-1 TaxID=216964 RepID=UPI0013978AFD|nr:hypothetical protein [Spiroplasma sp. BIUS-1]QHX36839.1 hypothetical protein SBIUS_v1c05860 [Spiroplasma sp. BIUS-1]